MEYPPLVAGQSARFAVHLTKLEGLQGAERRQAVGEFTPESGGPPTVFAGHAAAAARRVPRRRRAAGGRALPVGAQRRRARSDRPPRPRHRHGVSPTRRRPIAEAEKRPADDPAAIAYLKEQQWTNEFATAPVRDAELRHVDPRAGVDRAADRRRGDRGRAGGGPVYRAGRCCRSATTVRAGQVLGRLEPRLVGGDDRATLAADVAQAQVGVDGARAELTRAERLLAERAVPARRVEDARRARRGCRSAAAGRAGATAAARRDAAKRRRCRLGQRVRAARADRRPHRRGDGDAGRLVRRGRAALQDRPHRSRRTARAGARRRCIGGPQRRRCRARDSRQRPTLSSLRAEHMHDAGVIDPEDGRAAGAVRGRQPGRPAAGRADTRPRFCTGATRPRAGRPEGGGADRSRTAVRLGADRRRAVRPPLRRDRDARRRLVGIKSGVKPAIASSSVAPTKCSSRRRPKGCRPKGTFISRGPFR